MNRILQLILCIGITLLIGAIPGLLIEDATNTWYEQINRPGFAPPNWVFGPVWTILYILMGYSFYLVLQAPPSVSRKKAITIYVVQLFFNFCWSIIFFNLHLMGLALAEIMLLWFLILLMILQFFKIHKLSGLIQIPYLAWVTFATFLNGAFYMLNS